MNDEVEKAEKTMTREKRRGGEQGPLDLTSLDPSRDRDRWQGMVRSVAQRAYEARRASRAQRAQGSPMEALLTMARPALAVAAAVTLAVWVGALTRPGGGSEKRRGESLSSPTSTGRVTETSTSDFSSPLALAAFAVRGEYPSPSRFLQIVEGHRTLRREGRTRVHHRVPRAREGLEEVKP